MKLIVQIPCLNEEATLPLTLQDIPRQVDGFSAVEILIIDDGSTDNTVEVAREHGVDHIVSHNINRGLARAFRTGLDTCLALGADVIVNTDADNQYPGHMIPLLVAPIIASEADIVIGDRQTHQIPHFSPVKKLLQKAGSGVTSFAANTSIPDAPSGFRAYNRHSALQLNIFTDYTYTIETILQAIYKGLVLKYVPVKTNAQTRESRLVRNIPIYVWRAGTSILYLFVLYNPLRFFLLLGLPFLIVGLVLWGRFFILLFTDQVARGSNVQSLILATITLILFGLCFVMGLISRLIATNRRLQEEILYRTRVAQYDHQ